MESVFRSGRSMVVFLLPVLMITLLYGCAGVRQGAETAETNQAGNTPWMVRGRVLGAVPDESSDIDPIGGDANVEYDVTPEVDVSYFFSDHFALEAIGGTSRHAVDADNTAAGDVDVGEVSVVPATVTAQYHFRPKKNYKPYIGIGPHYAFFYNEDAPQSGGGGGISDVDYDNSPGGALQAGVDIKMGPPGWVLNIDVKKVFLQTDVDIDSAAGPVDADVDIDPWLIGIGFGYNF